MVGSVQCHTFAWAGTFKGDSPLRNGIANPVNEARLRGAIPAQSRDRRRTAGRRRRCADCLVGYGIGAQTSIEGAYPVGWGWGWVRPRLGLARWLYGGYWGWDEPYVYREGIIAVDLYDA